MLTEDEARQRILASITPLPPQRVPLIQALDHYAAETLFATVPLPGFDNSSMDGYAVRAEDTLSSTTAMRIVGEQPAGPRRDLTVSPGTAIRIFTGAPVPPGADAVIMQEDVDVLTQEGGRKILCREPVVVGENIRPAGIDLCQGQKILQAGERLTAARLGVLASQGLDQVAIPGPPRLVVATTGDELQAAGQPLQPGQIYNSNGIMLQSLVRRLTGISSTVAHLPDDLEVTTEGLRSLMAAHDFLILSGGVSVGDHDCVKPALRALGIDPEFWRVRIRPGKPFLSVVAQQPDGHICHLFGLPGNPVSSFVTFSLLVRPALLKALGARTEELVPQTRPIVLANDLTNRGDRPFYMCGRLAGDRFSTTGIQQSHALFGLSQANAMVKLDPNEQKKQGAEVTAYLF